MDAAVVIIKGFYSPQSIKFFEIPEKDGIKAAAMMVGFRPSHIRSSAPYNPEYFHLPEIKSVAICFAPRAIKQAA